MTTQLLVIEDDTQIRENLKEMLTLHGFNVETAVNGREGISQALLHPPDLILCDIMMPEVDGYHVLEVVRNNRLIANVPFIFLTAKTEPVDLRRGMDQGADDYLTKPFTLQNLMHTIESRLQREALRKADLKAKLESYRHNLASVAVHEYNTALTGIIGFSSMLIDQHDQFNGEETVTMVKMIKVCGLRLKRSLDNIQLIDALQHIDPDHSAYIHYSSGNTLLTAELIDRCALAVEQRQDRHVSYQVDVEPVQLSISADNLRICLVELVDNAVKFSDAGQSFTVKGEICESGYQIAVTNRGQPFNIEDSAHIGPYKQFDRSLYEQQGFGLGLAIVKKIVEFNKGKLTVESPTPGDTTVLIWLPQWLGGN
ncbi:hybrid sensor histidine kinase/response regulator [Spirosoma pollinicola]|uniref:histidine kinase n=1 Tax=Spirosoma pollinicola TaxID=2057025 RepID=A0A2K8Z759_9BACT|nr:response regulator [Spirosoma pollinicola]AUD05727.1 hybrid sensor histidine kinase/response regulator [Spirosoma pollinicola]